MEINKNYDIHERYYDNPKNEDGTDKDNNLLGNFKILEELASDTYFGKWIGEKDGKKFLIEETEVSGYYNPGKGGSRFKIIEIKNK